MYKNRDKRVKGVEIKRSSAVIMEVKGNKTAFIVKVHLTNKLLKNAFIVLILVGHILLLIILLLFLFCHFTKM